MPSDVIKECTCTKWRNPVGVDKCLCSTKHMDNIRFSSLCGWREVRAVTK